MIEVRKQNAGRTWRRLVPVTKGTCHSFNNVFNILEPIEAR